MVSFFSFFFFLVGFVLGNPTMIIDLKVVADVKEIDYKSMEVYRILVQYSETD